MQGAADHGVSEALYLADEDGNGIEIYRDRPRDEWPVVDGQLRMGADPVDLDALLAEAGKADSTAGLAAGTVIGHVHLHVARLQEARAFYVDVLGFELMQRYGPSALFVAAGGYHHHIGLNTWAGVGAPPPPPGAIGLNTSSCSCPTPARRRAASVPRGSPRSHSGGSAVTTRRRRRRDLGCADADGNGPWLSISPDHQPLATSLCHQPSAISHGRRRRQSFVYTAPHACHPRVVLAAATLALAIATPRAQAPAFDLVIRNGRIVDGTGSPWYLGDVASATTPSRGSRRASTPPAGRVIDAAGKIVAPGFIDLHTHSRRGIFQGRRRKITCVRA